MFSSAPILASFPQITQSASQTFREHFFPIMFMEKEICHATLRKAVAFLTRCQNEIQTWMARNKIYFNPTNLELLIGTRHHYSWVSFPGLSSDSLWSHEITLDSQSFPCKGQCSCLMFHFLP